MSIPRVKIYDVIILPKWEDSYFLVLDIETDGFPYFNEHFVDNYILKGLIFKKDSGLMDCGFTIKYPKDLVIVGYTLSPVNNFSISMKENK